MSVTITIVMMLVPLSLIQLNVDRLQQMEIRMYNLLC